jgi:hypothetical protein
MIRDVDVQNVESTFTTSHEEVYDNIHDVLLVYRTGVQEPFSLMTGDC